MSSDVCKHCTHAGCLDVCPTGALFRTEYGTVVVQGDICNGCGYCVPACPYGVIDQRKDDGRVFKCTMCYDRLTDGLMPACATACPTQSIQFGDLDELQARADARLATLKSQGVETARLYGRDEDDGVGGAGAFFLLLDEPEVYGLPPDPVVTTRDLPAMWRAAATAAAMMVGVALSAVLGSRAVSDNDGGVATPGAGWRRADGSRPRRSGSGAAAAGGGGGRGRDGRRRRVHVVLRPADREVAGVEDAGRAAVPVPRGAAGSSSILGAIADVTGRPP